MTAGTTGAAAEPTAARAGSAPSRTPLLAALALGVAAVLNAVGTFVSDGSSEHGWGDYLFVLAFSVAATALVFGWVVRTAPSGHAERRALVLGVLAALSFAVFWLGITAPLALGAVGCALVARDLRGRVAGQALVGVVLAALALVAVTVLAFVG